jgi:hypothetical protein
MDHMYRIAYHLGDSGFDIESTDKSWLDEKEKEYLAMLNAIPSRPLSNLIESGDQKRTVLPQNLTINEFYRNIVKANNITSRPEMAVFFVYYLEKVLKKESTKTADVTQCFADISYPGYNKLNVADILSKAKQKALLNYVNSLWSLTITGEDYIVNAITNPKA